MTQSPLTHIFYFHYNLFELLALSAKSFLHPFHPLEISCSRNESTTLQYSTVFILVDESYNVHIVCIPYINYI